MDIPLNTVSWMTTEILLLVVGFTALTLWVVVYFIGLERKCLELERTLLSLGDAFLSFAGRPRKDEEPASSDSTPEAKAQAGLAQGLSMEEILSTYADDLPEGMPQLLLSRMHDAEAAIEESVSPPAFRDAESSRNR